MPQKRISICTSRSVGSRREIVVGASGDSALAAAYAFALYIDQCSFVSKPLEPADDLGDERCRRLDYGVLAAHRGASSPYQ
jgi:hypothetical protein